MGSKTNGAVSKRKSAAEKARDARIKLYRDRDARDVRVEAAAAEVFTAQDELTAADEALAAVKAAAAASIAAAESDHQTAIESGEAAVSAALRKLTAEKLTATEIAELTSLGPADVRRLTKTVPAGPQASGKADAPETSPAAGSPGAAQTAKVDAPPLPVAV